MKVLKKDSESGLQSLKKRFVKQLLAWNNNYNRRIMPWKGEKDPYRIWLSEIILQQTRVEQGLKYYERFVEVFPLIKDLAKAPQQQVFKLWEGLGYYSRCKNLITSAQYITDELGGIFPKEYDSILALKGVGSYTASAIASFAYNLPYAVLDGNVFRVLSRIFCIDIPIDSGEGKKVFALLAKELLLKNRSAIYNQGIMDFGATICKPLPECAICFFKNHCKAFLEGRQLTLPVKLKRVVVKKRWFNYLVFSHDKFYVIHKRTQKDIWQSLFEFPLIESDKKALATDILIQAQKSYGLDTIQYKGEVSFVQRLTHQLIHFQFLSIELSNKQAFKNFNWVSKKELAAYPFPKTLQQYISSSL